MQRSLKTLGYLGAFYALPLIGVPARIVSPEIAFLAIAAAAVFLTQPDLSVSEASRRRDRDRSSMYAILFAGAAAQILPVVEWGYFGRSPHHPAVQVLGCLLVIGGLSLRVAAIRNLGSFFTSTVHIAEGQRVVTTGPHALVRHPSYLGALLAIAGSAVLLEAWFGLVIGACFMLAAYRHRITAEEEAMLADLGSEYRAYRAKTRFRLVPLLY